MLEARILLNTIEKVKEFSDVIIKANFDIDLISDRYIVDAKSIMGIFSLDISKPIEIVFRTTNIDEAKQFLPMIKRWLIEE